MRTIESNLYKYSELSESAKERARDWYREASAHDEWWDFVYEDAEQVANILGIDLDRKNKGQSPAIYFSGFSSQGDGACFEGSYKYAPGCVANIKAYAPLDEDLHSIAKALQEAQRKQFYKLEATIKHRGHYYHAYSMDIDVSHAEQRYKDIGDAEDAVKEALQDFANWIYRQLENEWEYQNRDDVVAENIIANEYEFDGDGNIA